MSVPEKRWQFAAAIRDHDELLLNELLNSHVDYLLDETVQSQYMCVAARHNNIAAMTAMVSRGADINAMQSMALPHPPLWSAVCGKALDAAHWLIARGSIINEHRDWGDICYSLNVAAREGPIEMVRLLVGAGANINGVSKGNTPLSFARLYGQPEIAAYLRGLGALEPAEIPGALPPPLAGPIIEYMRRHVGEPNPVSLQSLLTDGPDVAVYCVFGETEVTVFTDGMSSMPMATPPGKEAHRFAELVMHLPAGWSVDEASLRADPELQWPFEWLMRLSRLPFDAETWLGHPMSIVANGDPPEPLSPTTAMTCWMLLEGAGGLEPLDVDGRRVFFYHAVPLHTAERDLEVRKGERHLLDILREKHVGLTLTADPERQSVV